MPGAACFSRWLTIELFPVIAATPSNTCGSGYRPAPDPKPALSDPALNLFDPNFLKKQSGVDNNDNAEKETIRGSAQGGRFNPFIMKCSEGLTLLCCVWTYPHKGTARFCTSCKLTACFLSTFNSQKKLIGIRVATLHARPSMLRALRWDERRRVRYPIGWVIDWQVVCTYIHTLIASCG